MSARPSDDEVANRLHAHYQALAEDLANGAEVVTITLKAMTAVHDRAEMTMHGDMLRYSADGLRRIAAEIERIADAIRAYDELCPEEGTKH